MAWFKVDDKLHSSPKWRGATKGARALWSTAGSWCSDQLTDGNIPKAMLRALDGTPADAASLVSVGLWETTTDGWCFHDWSEYQPDAASVRAKRESESAGGSYGNHKRWHVKKNVNVPDCPFCTGEESGTRSGTQSGSHRLGGESGANPPDPYPNPIPDPPSSRLRVVGDESPSSSSSPTYRGSGR